LAAIRAQAPDARVTYLDGHDLAAATAAAKTADVVLVFATQWRTEAEDVPNLTLPEGQDTLIAAVAAANPRTAVIVESGGAVLMPWLNSVGAVVEAWYPGQRGGQAIAQILFGKTNPSGHLPLTFPASEAQAPRPAPVGLDTVAGNDAASNAGSTGAVVATFPVDYTEGADAGYRWYASRGEKPLFPFGFGLSYTHFGYSRLHVAAGPQPTVSFAVTNLGAVAGADVPQVYVTPPGAKAPRLAAFQRITLAPGETRAISLPIEPRVVSQWDGAHAAWHLAPGTFTVRLAHDVTDPGMTAKIALGR
jgi:beta-glucosidase